MRACVRKGAGQVAGQGGWQVTGGRGQVAGGRRNKKPPIKPVVGHVEET